MSGIWAYRFREAEKTRRRERNLPAAGEGVGAKPPPIFYLSGVVWSVTICPWAYGSRSEPPSYIIDVDGAWES
ncbi:hypothetical protein TNCV_2478841 [Trichonephila clavipes]|nr:hypothetical protein TNCV_2478841 [Trichonephila clavipes]